MTLAAGLHPIVVEWMQESGTAKVSLFLEEGSFSGCTASQPGRSLASCQPRPGQVGQRWLAGGLAVTPVCRTNRPQVLRWRSHLLYIPLHPADPGHVEDWCGAGVELAAPSDAAGVRHAPALRALCAVPDGQHRHVSLAG